MVIKVWKSALNQTPLIYVDHYTLSRGSLRWEILEIHVDGGVVFEYEDLFHTSVALAALSSVILLKTVKKSKFVLEAASLSQ